MKYIYLFLVLLSLNMSSCTKDNGRHLFDTEIEVNFDIPAGLNNLETHYFNIKNIPSFYEEKKSIYGVSDDDILKSLANRASIIPRFQEVDYGFIRDISIKLYDDEYPRSEAFYLETVRISEENELNLLSSLTNLKDILSKPTFDLEIRINFKTFTVRTTENKIKLNFSSFGQL